MVDKFTNSTKVEVNRWLALLVALIAVVSSTVAAYDRIVFNMQNDRIARTENRLERHETMIRDIEMCMQRQTQMLTDIKEDIQDIKEMGKR